MGNDDMFKKRSFYLLALLLLFTCKVSLADTPLVSGQSISSSVTQGDWKYYEISSGSGTSVVTVQLTGLSADVDLYVRKGAQPTVSSYDCRPYRGGTTSETCTVTLATSTTVYIGVRGFRSGSFTLTATLSGGSGSDNDDAGSSGIQTLTSGQSVSGSVSQGGWRYYKIVSGSGNTSVSVQMTGLSADVDLYVRKGAQPTVSSYDCRPYLGGTTAETCTLTLNTSTTVYVGVRGFRSGSFTLKATLMGSVVDDDDEGQDEDDGFNTDDNGIQTLTSGQSVSGSVSQGGWRYYKIVSGSGNTSVSVQMTGLNADVDLYVRKGAQPTVSSYDCRPNRGGTTAETCIVTLNTSTIIYIGVRGYRSGSFTLKATLTGSIVVDDDDDDNIQTLTSGQSVSGSVSLGAWKHYRIFSGSGTSSINVEMTGLSADVDLYVRKGAQPTASSYDCRPYRGGTTAESCTLTLNTSTTIYISVRGYRSGSYTLKATLGAEEVSKKAVLLLHGLASNMTTWDDLVSNNLGFDGQCTNLSPNSTPFVSGPNSEGVYCFRMNFGSRDRSSGLRGLGNISCTQISGCSGDFSTYSQLGLEVQEAVEQIRESLGDDVGIVLLGHSRGGLAARAFLQRYELSYSNTTENIVALITTGTPHLGSPLGRIYDYMDQNCTPRSSHENDNDNGACEHDWEAADQIFNNGEGLDLSVPGIDLLSDNSNDLLSMNIRAFLLSEEMKYVELVYTGETLGNLIRSFGSTYNPFPSVSSVVDVFAQDFSSEAEDAVLGENSADDFEGDGIVPNANQRLSAVSSFSRDFQRYTWDDDVLHIEETGRVTNIFSALQYVYEQLGW